MNQQGPKYRKLKGRAPGIAGVTQLWLGEDHLLSVTSVMGFETYRRFFFRDIEALIAMPSARRLIFNVILSLVILFIAAIGTVVWIASGRSGGEGVTLAMAAMASPFLIGLIVNALLGPSCSLWAQIGGRLEPLEAPVRLRYARKLIETVSPIIEQAQAAASSVAS